VVKEGEMVKVKLMEIDDRGRLNFSMKALMERPPRDPKPEKSHN
jgi:predicted RNA-binding protein with RPS1 domain